MGEEKNPKIGVRILVPVSVVVIFSFFFIYVAEGKQSWG